MEFKKEHFTTVTQFSKYLALALFIAMPFIGGWIGYTYSPEKVVEVEKVVVKEVTVTQTVSETSVPENVPPIDEYAECITNGGTDWTPDYNAPKRCILDNKVSTLNCVANDNYFIVQEDTLRGAANIVVRKKIYPDQMFACEYSTDGAYFVFESGGPYYLMALESDYMILDYGTGPFPRGMEIYDLRNKEMVFSDGYTTPVQIENETISYWRTSKKGVTLENCAQYGEYSSQWLAAALEEHILLDLTTLATSSLREGRCTERE